MADISRMVEFPPDFPFVRRAEAPHAPKSDNPPPVQAPQEDPPVPPAPSLTADVPAPTKPRVERRKYQRDRMVAQAMIHADRVKLPPARVNLVDISIAGVRFQAPRPLDVGEKLQIRLEVGPFRWTT